VEEGCVAGEAAGQAGDAGFVAGDGDEFIGAGGGVAKPGIGSLGGRDGVKGVAEEEEAEGLEVGAAGGASPGVAAVVADGDVAETGGVVAVGGKDFAVESHDVAAVRVEKGDGFGGPGPVAVNVDVGGRGDGVLAVEVEGSVELPEFCDDFLLDALFEIEALEGQQVAPDIDGCGVVGGAGADEKTVVEDVEVVDGFAAGVGGAEAGAEGVAEKFDAV
jgi:hypothetical protein